MPLPFPPESQMFEGEQQPFLRIEYWPTPFTPLRNDIASAGIRMWVREPNNDGVMALGAGSAFQLSTAANAQSTFNAATARTVVDDGRTANLIGYWAGGAPGYHGVSVERRVAYHFQAFVRTPSGRDWFTEASTFSAAIACHGNGYLRVVHTPASTGTPVDLINTTVDETSFLDKNVGPVYSPTALFETDDKLDFYYVQDQTKWGGFFFKMVYGGRPLTVKLRRLALRENPLIGCGLMDDGTSTDPEMEKQSFDLVRGGDYGRSDSQTTRMGFQVPLANTDSWDGIGWEWVREGEDNAGFLRLHDFQPDGEGVVERTVDLKRNRLIRIKSGFTHWDDSGEEAYTIFTGFIDDFEGVASGTVSVNCLGIEQRAADQSVKNYPDLMSYMQYGYSRLSGTVEPVFNTAAYDNWFIELAIKDMLLRCGIDESRLNAPLLVPQPDGTAIEVEM